MHPALRINEVVELIAQNLVHSSSNKPDLKSLRAMALVCRAFCESAMDASWHRASPAKRLLCIFPPGVVSSGHRRRAAVRPWGNWEILRHPSEAEWARFDYYAKRVRSLSWIVCEDERVGVLPRSKLSFIGILKMHYGDSAAFQNLNALECDKDSIPHTKYWTLFVQSQLVSLAMPVWACSPAGPSVAISRIFQSMSTQAPFMKNIDLRSTVKISPDAIRLLAGMPNLRKLRLAVDSDMDTLLLQKLSSTTAFPSLEDLRVFVVPSKYRVNECTFPGALLSRISSPFLRTVEIDCRGAAPTMKTLFRLFSAISSFRATLSSFRLYIYPVGLFGKYPGDSANPIPFRPLVNLLCTIGQSLRTLDLSFVPLQLSTEDLREILSSCVNLRGLHLGETHRNTISSMDVLELANVPKMAPQLRKLGIRVVKRGIIRAVAQDTDREPMVPNRLGHMLEELSFGFDRDITGERYSEVTKFVRGYFPNASVIVMPPDLRYEW